ncbi:putative N-acetyltransferase 14 [Branchiostoma floridae x Branchiostoma japonicum]
MLVWLYMHAERRELDNLYSWYNDKAGSRFWVVVCGGKIAGTVALDRTSDTVAELKRMSVLPEYRRRGVATRLMNRFEEFCKSDGVKEIFLTTSFVQLEAVRLYQKCGYVISNTTEVGFRLEKMM